MFSPLPLIPKSVLRAVAGSVAAEFDDVDYFPSYEVITGAKARGRFFADNLRSVEPVGVATVMATFFAESLPSEETAPETASAGNVPWQDLSREERRARRQARAESDAPPPRRKRRERGVDVPVTEEDVVCEEALLEAFAR